MKYFVTSDFHFGHGNIIKYCRRPFRDLAHMNDRLKHNYNERVKPEDTCFILGDFCFRNSAGGNQGEGTPTKWSEYFNQLNGNKVLIRGNHDTNNSVKSIMENAVINYAGLRIGMVHDPADFLESTEFNRVDFNLCGHVHQNWRHQWRGHSMQHLIINVGVDVWKFYPITLDEVLKYRVLVMKSQASYGARHEHSTKSDTGHHAGEWKQRQEDHNEGST
jgi:calcineurin-like phosphoesterase family protein